MVKKLTKLKSTCYIS